MRIRKKTFILLITYLTAAVIALGAYACVQSLKGANYRRTAEYGYEHAFEEVVLAVDELDTALKKASFAVGPEIGMRLCGDIYSSCLAAEMTMAALPFSSYELEKTTAFIGVCGDYAASLLETCAQSGLGETERQNMAALSEISDGLAKELGELQSAVNSGEVVHDAPEELIHKDDGDELLSVRMKAYEKTVSELPELSYEGKYTSDGGVTADGAVSEAEALTAAQSFTGKQKLELCFTSEDKSRCFSFDGGVVVVDRKGRVKSYSSEGSVAGDMSDDELILAAESFLSEKGYDDMRILGSYRADSVLTATFAPVDVSGVLLSDATLTVSIAASDASLYAFNAAEYLEATDSECSLTPDVTEDEAAKALPEGLEVTDCELALYSRRLCYDFTLRDADGKELHILVDASTGRQFDIVI